MLSIQTQILSRWDTILSTGAMYAYVIFVGRNGKFLFQPRRGAHRVRLVLWIALADQLRGSGDHSWRERPAGKLEDLHLIGKKRQMAAGLSSGSSAAICYV